MNLLVTEVSKSGGEDPVEDWTTPLEFHTCGPRDRP